jgi:hypothetical protein
MSNERLFCAQCGTANEPDARFCESCGSALGQAAPVAASAPASLATASKGSSRKTVGILAAVLVLGGAAYAFASPLKSFLGIGANGTQQAAATDSLEFAPVATEPQLNDNPGQQTPVDPVVTEVPVQAPPEMPRQAEPAPAPRVAQSRPRETSAPVSSAPSARAMPMPDEPPAFPDFKVPQTGPGGADARASQPSPAAPPAAVASPGRIPAGAVLALRSADQVCSDKTQQGARFRAVLQQEVTGSNGATIPQGTIVTFVVDRAKRASGNEKAEFSVAPEALELGGDRYPISATVDQVTIKQKSRSVLGALAGAAVTAAATRAAGGDTKQTIAGGVVGGAAGAVIGNQIRAGDGCIEKNATMRITLASDITMRM